MQMNLRNMSNKRIFWRIKAIALPLIQVISLSLLAGVSGKMLKLDRSYRGNFQHLISEFHVVVYSFEKNH